MAEFVAQSSTTSATSRGKRRVSKNAVRADNTLAIRRDATACLSPLFAELARLAEMSEVERRLRDFGFRAIAGTDEVGRGCLAGPVVAACVVLDREPALPGVDDSKLLDENERARICRTILAHARAAAIGVIDAATIDRINILQASKRAMHAAVETLGVRPDVLLVDAVVVETLDMPQLALIHGDRRSVSVAAASIVAKVYRDFVMQSYDAVYPEYDFARNRGYGTEIHQQALARFGPCPIHRQTFLSAREPLLFTSE
ncbi:MAG: ribonuclease HII [Thermoanaerobaculia bacterium]